MALSVFVQLLNTLGCVVTMSGIIAFSGINARPKHNAKAEIQSPYSALPYLEGGVHSVQWEGLARCQ
jgi:hypothetical protein